MGAWGQGSFANDTALDWATSVQSIDDVRKPFEQLKAATDAAQDGDSYWIESDHASELIAAAETVAMMMGRRIPDFPEDLAQRLGAAGEVDDRLYHQARNAVCHVLRNSELAELWQEGVDEDEVNEWHVEITELLDRLNPEVEFEPRVPGDTEAMATDIGGHCAFCDGPIEKQQLWAMRVYDGWNLNSVSTKSLSCHLTCLNARLHHKHAVLDFKFDPDRPFDDDMA